jgi:hypothetical protein
MMITRSQSKKNSVVSVKTSSVKKRMLPRVSEPNIICTRSHNKREIQEVKPDAVQQKSVLPKKKIYEPSIIRTRSQCRLEKEKMVGLINFDEASSSWMKNKRRLGNGMYSYIH